MKKRKTRVRIVNKVRFTMFCIVMISLFSCGISAAMNYAMAQKEPETLSVFVETGDTLWDIAVEHNTKNQDVRRLVRQIKQHNGLTSSVIRAGEVLEIPLL